MLTPNLILVYAAPITELVDTIVMGSNTPDAEVVSGVYAGTFGTGTISGVVNISKPIGKLPPPENVD